MRILLNISAYALYGLPQQPELAGKKLAGITHHKMQGQPEAFPGGQLAFQGLGNKLAAQEWRVASG